MDKLPLENAAEDAASQAPRTEDDARVVDLSEVPNDADDRSDAGVPTTDHDPVGWRADPPSKP